MSQHQQKEREERETLNPILKQSSKATPTHPHSNHDTGMSPKITSKKKTLQNGQSLSDLWELLLMDSTGGPLPTHCLHKALTNYKGPGLL